MKRLNRLPVFFAVIFNLLWFSSCRTAREVPVVELKSVSAGKLLKEVEKNALDYDYFTIKRINASFSGTDSKTNFKLNLKAKRDEVILASISKLNIPVGKILLTPDSVKYVNYLEKNYFIDDYSYLSDVLNIDLDFETIQSILSNNAFSYRNDPRQKDFRTFDSSTEDGLYVLQSEKDRKLDKFEDKGKNGKIRRRLNRLGDEALIVQKMFFDPRNFALKKLVIFDKSNDRTMEMDFDDFVKVEKTDYPGSMEMIFISSNNTVSIKTRMSGFSTDKISSFNFNIPEKYDQIKVN